MNLEAILSELQAPDLLEAVRPRWQESVASFPDGGPEFLRPEQVQLHRDWCGLDAGLEPALVAAAGRISSSRTLALLAWHYYRMIFEYDPAPSGFRLVPLDRALGGDAALFYLLVALAMVPRIRRLHRALGVPEAVTRDTCLQVKCMCGNYQRANGGRPGVFDQINWLRYFVDGSLFFRLGRLEYWRKPFNGEYRVFRRRRDGRTIALAGPAWRINDAGWIEGVGAEAESRPGWETVLRQTGAGAFGFPIHPRGFVEREPVRLPAADWDCVLEKGTPVLDLHIPAGGGLTPEACADSFRRAAEFFRRHFPEPAPRAMVCSSWICSPILEQILPPGSNLVAFLREVYLCPLNSRGPASLWFVFLQKPFDPATAPRETSLQRALLAYLESGREWRNGSLFFLLDDLPRFGRQWPRAQYAAADVAAIQRGGSVRQCPDLGSTS